MTIKNQFLLSWIILFFATTNFAQNKTIDSLKLALKNAKDDTTRCNVLNIMISQISDDAVWPEYNKQLLVLAEKNLKQRSSLDKFYMKHLADANNGLGFLYQIQGDVKKSLDYIQKSLKLYEKINNKSGIATSLNNIAYIYESQGDIAKALDYYQKSLKIKEEINDKNAIAISLNNIGVIYKNQGNLVKTIEYLNKSLEINEEIGNKNEIALSLNNIACVYKDQGNIPKAIEYYSKSLKNYEEIDYKSGIALCFNNLGSIYHDQNEYEKAYEYYNKSLKIREELGDKNAIATSLNNISTLYKDQGENTKAFLYLNKSLKIYEEVGNKDGIAHSFSNLALIHKVSDQTKALMYYTKSIEIYKEINDKKGIANSLNSIGEILSKQKQYPKALELTLNAMKLSKELGFPEIVAGSAKTLNTIYKAMGNYKGALENYELYITMRDSTMNQENKKASIKSQFKYEYDKKAAADSVKVAEEKKVVAVQLKQEKTQRFALYGGLALVLVFAGFMFNRFRVTQKQKNIIELKEKETQQQNEIITIQKHLVEEKHKEITDSINYAERIQRSFLATDKQLNENLNNYFVLFKPKDVVSGDFYWSAKLNNGNFALATADSTGHGVPGAIMSLLNVTSLEKAIEHYTNPADILNHTRQTIIERLKKDGSEEGGKDGMDCSLLVFDFTNKQLLIAAANNPVWIIRSNSPFEGGVRRTGDVELIEIKPDKMPVGKSDKQDQSFTTHTLELQKGDTIYTLTDGFPDQFGGPNGKKFMSKKLKELLLANVVLPIAQQKELLDTAFKNWVGDLEQVDDVCVIGIRV